MDSQFVEVFERCIYHPSKSKINIKDSTKSSVTGKKIPQSREGLG